MSRHKIVKNMDLDDEMDDYDGGDDYADDGAEGLTPFSHSTVSRVLLTLNPRAQRRRQRFADPIPTPLLQP